MPEDPWCWLAVVFLSAILASIALMSIISVWVMFFNMIEVFL